MTTSFLSIVSYVLVSTFTPGPSNISSASMAVLHGYKKTLSFQTGLAIGVFILMVVIGWFSKTLLNVFPSLEPIMRYVGAGYILYLAFGILKASYSITEDKTKPLGLANGLMLQILNPKLTVYAFTLFSAFLAPITANVAILLFAALTLAVTSFCATSLWALFGAAIQSYLLAPRWRFVVNLLLSVSLIYTALTLIRPN
ncbi:MAG TPA: LysE family transporter [Anaerolineales bacterium]|nr:LysE family transporter [Anaerolineales bacterium]